MRLIVVTLVALLGTASAEDAGLQDASIPIDAGSGADGRCTVAEDCLVKSATCADRFCTIDTPVELFPTVAGLAEITLHDPAELGRINAVPSLDWVPPVGVDLIAAAIWPEVPRYDMTGTRIDNLIHASWVWHSSLPGASTSVTGVRYSEGRGILPTSTPGNELLTEDEPAPLEDGVYYWAVWGWTGTQLTYRSVVRTFVVGSENITGRSCDECSGVAALRCNINDTNSFCIIACASDIDCYQGTTCDLSQLDPNHPWGICRVPGPTTSYCGPSQIYDSDLKVCIDEPPEAGCESCSHGGGTSGIVPFATVMIWILRRRSLRRR